MPIRSFHGCVALLLATCTTIALAAPPAPQVTARANGVKQLRFDWNAVSGATSYELWFRSGINATPSRFFQLPASQRSAVNNVSVHLLDWNNARYWVNACDATGCTSSSPLSVSNLMPDTIGLFASPSQQTASQFGFAVAMSRDGTTFAVAAPTEATDDPQLPKGSAYVYRRSGGAWVFQSAIPFDISRDAGVGRATLALSGNGNVLAIGLSADTPHGAQNGIGRGSVKLFRFVEGNGWRHDATIGPYTGFELLCCDQVELDDRGMTLAVKTEVQRSGVFIYTYDNAGTWSHTGTIVGHGNAPENGETCGQFAFSADGNVVARVCSAVEPTPFRVFEVYAAPGWGIRDTIPMPAGRELVNALSADATGDALAISSRSTTTANDSGVDVYRRINGSYLREVSLRRGAWENNSPGNAFGVAGQFSGDGKFLAITDTGDHGVGTGSLAPPLTAGTAATGAVYVFERRANGWTLRRVVKPGRAGAGYATGTFGRDIAFGDNGKTLVVGQPGANNDSGVAWLY
jgi:trimeric autotransporter adhesin